MKSAAILAAMTGLLVTLASASAFADTVCTVDAVVYKNDPSVGGQIMQVRCAENIAVWYTGAVSYPSCPGNPVDAVKSWLSLGEAALLAGKTVTLTWAVCNGQNMISVIILNK